MSPLSKPTPAAPRSRRIALFDREIRERLSPPAVELLLSTAEVLSEGQVAERSTSGQRYYGTTMLTMELPRLGEQVRERCNASAARRVAALVATDVRIARHAQALAEREAARVAGRKVFPSATELHVRAEGTRVLIDVDFEGGLDPHSGRRRVR